MKTSKKMTLSFPVLIKGTDRYFFYGCPGFDVWSVGKTREEAERRLKKDLQLLLARCSKYNSLDKMLSDSGFTNVEVRV
jgi:predicted RNase H-like HicB family nuclease